MKLLNLVVTLHTGLAVVSSTVVQTSDASISSRDESAFAEASLANPFDALLPRALEKRKGGGGSSSGGGGGGGRGGSSGSSGGRSGGSRGSTGSTGSRGSGGSTGSSGFPSSRRPSFGRGNGFYAGGARVPFRSGASSPARRIAPFFLAGAALSFFPGFLYGAYVYPYTNPYTFLNRTNGINETLPVTCLCDLYSECGCDEDDDLSYLDTIIGNGSIASLDRTLVNIAPVNETKTIVLNGTLPNGTDTGSASSGGSSESRPANTGQASLIEAGGFWVIGVIVAATVWVL